MVDKYSGRGRQSLLHGQLDGIMGIRYVSRDLQMGMIYMCH